MPKFTFEIVGRGEVRAPAFVLELPNERAIWSSVEALALRVTGWQGAFVRVKNARGDTLIRAGVSTALASIESCTADCPLKMELKHFLATGQHSDAERELLVNCPMTKVAIAA
jgi:hypothetical protein